MTNYTGRIPTNRAQAERLVGKTQLIKKVPGVQNTAYHRMPDKSLELRYWGNTIMTFHADGTRSYTTAGWATPSTHARLNAILPEGAAFRTIDHLGVLEIRRPRFSFRYDSDLYELVVDTDGEMRAREIGDRA